MPWWLVWVILVVAALGVFAWIGLRLWRSVKALGREVAKAEVVLERLEARVRELDELAGEVEAIAPQIVLSPQQRTALHEVRAGVRATRRARRRFRFERAAAQWDDISGGPRADARAAAAAAAAHPASPSPAALPTTVMPATAQPAHPAHPDARKA
ncbi:hypothetical protein FH969_13105 [Miniimonas arenae]|uniref:Uncharacterized protein n=2 Tax=Miniimonas arenae TaxID=676201 RepID=A0A5C5B9D2_9MICO|nr:hypothetical protein [Miniimonas arenae]TNU73114.1 hypothetical protein FH969_13105 [Miniimonas arenae]